MYALSYLITAFFIGVAGNIIAIEEINGTFLRPFEQIPPMVAFSFIIPIMAIIYLIEGLIHFYYIVKTL